VHRRRVSKALHIDRLVDFRGEVDHPILHDEADAADVADVLSRIAVDEDQIRALVRLDRAELCEPATAAVIIRMVFPSLACFAYPAADGHQRHV
jgi:hypothetical protein